jgi:hypothetical protein
VNDAAVVAALEEPALEEDVGGALGGLRDAGPPVGGVQRQGAQRDQALHEG